MGRKLELIDIGLAVVVGATIGLILGSFSADLRGIRQELKHFNAYNDASEQLYQCYHRHGYCEMMWDGESYVITPEPEEWVESEDNKLMKM